MIYYFKIIKKYELQKYIKENRFGKDIIAKEEFKILAEIKSGEKQL